jgi:hypothetical protein
MTTIRTAEDVVTTLLPRWRASLPSGLSPADADAFITRHRGPLLALITGALAALDGRGGPRTAEDFAAFDLLVAPNRRRDEGPDEAVLARVLRRVDAVLAEGYGELGVLQNQGREYVDVRAEAILVRKSGWDAVPVLSILPALAIVVGGGVVAVRSSNGTLGIHPTRAGTLNHLHAAVFKAETRIVELADQIDVVPNTRERLARYAVQLWDLARADGNLGNITEAREP